MVELGALTLSPLFSGEQHEGQRAKQPSVSQQSLLYKVQSVLPLCEELGLVSEIEEGEKRGGGRRGGGGPL